MRTLEVAGLGDEGEPLAPSALSDELSMQDWQRVRDRQAGGPFVGAQPVSMAAAAAPAVRLGGRAAM